MTDNYSEVGTLFNGESVSNENGRKEFYFCTSASLALHLGIFLLLSTATAMSTGLNLSEVSPIRVTLVSMETVSQSYADMVQKVAVREKMPSKREQIKAESAVAVRPMETQKGEESAVDPVPSSGVAIPLENPVVAAASRTVESGRSGYDIPGLWPAAGVTVAIPRYRENTSPAYPLVARMKGYEGLVLLSAEISTDGKVENLRIKRTSGYQVLDKSALDAVKGWKFEPAKKMGKPTAMWVDVPVKFVLRDHENM